MGTDDTGATDDDPTGNGAQGNNMTLVTEWDYLGGGGCTNCGGGGGGLLGALTQHVDASTARTTQYFYNLRDMPQYVTDPFDAATPATYTRNYYDNLSRVIKVERYHDVAKDGVDPIVGGAADDVLLARAETLYDERGRVYQTKRTPVVSGTAGTALLTNYWYDAAGNRTAMTDNLNRQTTWAYDFVGRMTKQTLPDPDGGGATGAVERL